jgi:hypothetical protein
MYRPDTGVIDLVDTETGLWGGPTEMRMTSREGEKRTKGNHQAELDAALTRALTVTLWEGE